MFLISGMHRSGTSLVARFFFEAGGDFGDPATLYPADHWNPDGYFEQPAIHAINIPLINGPWGRLAYFNLPSTKTILRRAVPMESAIRETARRFEGRIVKETRFCLTLPAWRRYDTEFRHVVVCLRHPNAVACSLARRNWITIGLAHRLWKTHVERLLESTRDVNVWYVRYDHVVDPQLVGDELLEPFRRAGISLDVDEIRKLQSRLVRSGGPANPADLCRCPPGISRLWDELLERHSLQRSNT